MLYTPRNDVMMQILDRPSNIQWGRHNGCRNLNSFLFLLNYGHSRPPALRRIPLLVALKSALRVDMVGRTLQDQ